MKAKRKMGLTTQFRGAPDKRIFRRACPTCDYRSKWYPSLKASHVETHCATCDDWEGIPLNINFAQPRGNRHEHNR